MVHKHKVERESQPYALQGMCDCPGCHNAFSLITQRCRCGAEREICSGMGATSLARHVAYGYSTWREPRDELGRQ